MCQSTSLSLFLFPFIFFVYETLKKKKIPRDFFFFRICQIFFEPPKLRPRKGRRKKPKQDPSRQREKWKYIFQECFSFFFRLSICLPEKRIFFASRFRWEKSLKSLLNLFLEEYLASKHWKPHFWETSPFSCCSLRRMS